MFASESLAQALRQLEVYGRDGLPVISADGSQVEGWITSATLLRALARQITGTQAAAIPARSEPADAVHGCRQHRDIPKAGLTRRRRPRHGQRPRALPCGSP